MNILSSLPMALKRSLFCLVVALVAGAASFFVVPVSTAHAQAELSDSSIADESQIYKVYLPSTMTAMPSSVDTPVTGPMDIELDELLSAEALAALGLSAELSAAGWKSSALNVGRLNISAKCKAGKIVVTIKTYSGDELISRKRYRTNTSLLINYVG